MQEELDPSLSEGIEAHHVTHRKAAVRGAAYPLYLWSAVAAYRRVHGSGFQPDVIHAHVYGAAVPAAIVASRTGIPLVITEHFSGVAQRSLSRLEARRARYAYKRAARILPVSRFLLNTIRSYGIDRPFEVVPNVVDTSIFYPAHEKPKPGAKWRLLFVGNLEPLHLKGFPTLLRALAHVRGQRDDWQLDVVGDGPERTSYETFAAELGLGEHVNFLGSRPKLGVAEMMREAHLLVLPSRVETFGAVVAEALVCGLPVVSTTAGGIPELVDEHSGRLVPPNDAVALAEALAETLENIETFDACAISAAARNRYSLEAVGDRLSWIYESVLAESPASAVAPRASVL